MATVLYHVSPTANRESIERLGLRSQWLEEQVPSRYTPGQLVDIPRPTIFAIKGQPAALYLALDLAGARRYAQHIWDRFRPRPGAHVFSLDLWEVQLPENTDLNDDHDWITPAVWTLADIPPGQLKLLETLVPAAGA